MHRKIDAAGGRSELKLYRHASHSDPIKAFSPMFGGLPVLDDLVEFLDAGLGLQYKP